MICDMQETMKLGVMAVNMTLKITGIHKELLKVSYNYRASECEPEIHMIRGEPERAPNTRETGSGFVCIICILVCMFNCLWGDHFSEERVKF